MKYLCLVYQDENHVNALSSSDHEADDGDVFAFHELLAGDNRLLASSALQPIATATTVRVRNDRLLIADGPYAETKEQLGGYFLVDARDLNEAIRLASGMPSARLGSIEIRPVKEMYGFSPNVSRVAGASEEANVTGK